MGQLSESKTKYVVEEQESKEWTLAEIEREIASAQSNIEEYQAKVDAFATRKAEMEVLKEEALAAGLEPEAAPVLDPAPEAPLEGDGGVE